MYSQDQLKQQVAAAAIEFILPKLSAETILGIGTGSTVDLFIDALAQHKGLLRPLHPAQSALHSVCKTWHRGLGFESNSEHGLVHRWCG